MAKAYWVTWYRAIHDLSAHAKYAALAGPAILARGGRFLVRGMPSAAPEGDKSERAVVVEFDGGIDQALAAYHSAEYQAALAVLGDATQREVRFFEAAESVGRERGPDVSLRPALPSDAAGIAACVCEAYVHYVQRIGKQPGPMLDDYSDVIAQASVHVAISADRIVGAIVLKDTDEGFYVDNVAVHPAFKGAGVGRLLLQLAESEAKARGCTSLYLATHELMVENRALYARIGYVDYDHRVVNGYPRVFFRKQLSTESA